MANLKEIRNRITSIGSTMKITSAMKMVSAAKLKKAQDAIQAMRPYSNKLTELLHSLSSTFEGEAGGVFAEQKPVSKVLLVVVTSNRGLCGGFNSSIVKAVRRIVESQYADKKVVLYTIGKKGNDILSKEFEVFDNNNQIFDTLTFDNSARIASQVMEAFAGGEFDKVELVYNSFKNAATQIVMHESYLPLQAPEQESSSSADYIFEPSKEEIVLELIPKSLKMQLYKVLRDSFAGEHGARMTAMHKATDNAKELQDDLKLTYNKARQAAITGEILEIVGGAEALKG